MDVVVRATRLPALDETLMGSAWEARPGGKGGNQAVAAARMGARVAFLGAVGEDAWGRTLRAHLREEGVEDSAVTVDPGRGSGMSVAIETATAQYGAVVVSGANLGIDAARVAAWDVLREASVLMLQSEVPDEVNLAAARAASGKVILNAAPARPVGPELMGLVDVLVVNRVEATMLTGEAEVSAALDRLWSEGRAVVVTLGGDGLLLADRDGARHAIPGLRVTAVSTHGAGDYFCGALARALIGAATLWDACYFANAAAGGLVATPTRERARLGRADG